MVAFCWPSVDAWAQGRAAACQGGKQHFSHTVILTPAFLASFTTTGGNHLNRLGSKPPPESALFPRTGAWDLVSLTKPFSQFAVVCMNIHTPLLGSVCAHKKHNVPFPFFFYLQYVIPLFHEQCVDMIGTERWDFSFQILLLAWFFSIRQHVEVNYCLDNWW